MNVSGAVAWKRSVEPGWVPVIAGSPYRRDQFKPEDPKAAQPTRRDMPDLRESTKKVPEGAYEEDESLMGEGAPRTLGPEKETDTQRQ